jgi:alkylated DNA repair protein (DNA oxidative demethylase)
MTGTLFSALPVGTIHLASFCGDAEQVRLLELCKELVAEFPLMQPRTKSGFPLSLQVTSWGHVGWFGSAGRYEYLTCHANGKGFPPIPTEVSELMMRAATEAGFSPFRLDTVLLNFYPPQTGKLGRHQDLTEEDRVSPIVTVSLGDTCVFNVGSEDYDDRGTDVELRSGDVVVMGGRSRLAFHGIMKVIAGTSMLLKRGGRISLTGRRVFK